jgi:large subunit ribosomal protein LP0
MGKNTLVRKAMRDICNELPEIESLLPFIKGNVGLVFTNGEMKQIREALLANRIEAPAKVGIVAQCDVIVPAGNTGISPDKTSFFQALSISTKVVKGAIEITADVHLIKEGTKVGASEAELLTMLNIQPFTYGCVIQQVYDQGSVFDPSMLDMTDETLLGFYYESLRSVASISMAINMPTLASVPHELMRAYKNVIAVALASDYPLPEAEKIKESMAASTQASADVPVSTSAGQAKTGSTAAKDTKPESDVESDEDMGFDLFD